MRGKVREGVGKRSGIRITPAHAGKRGYDAGHDKRL